MRKKAMWHLPTAQAETTRVTLIETLGVSPLIAQLLAQRGYSTPSAASAYLSPDHYPPAPPEALPDLVLAADHLRTAIATDTTILVWGDFDVAGQTSTALLVDGLRKLGAQVEFYIPHRLRASHGIRLDS